MNEEWVEVDKGVFYKKSYLEGVANFISCDKCKMTHAESLVSGVECEIYYGTRYCKNCHPCWKKREVMGLSNMYHFKSGRKVSNARIAFTKDRMRSRDDNQTIVNRSTGRQPEGWVGK